MTVRHFLKRGNWFAKRRDRNTAGEPGGGWSEDIFFREGSGKAVDDVQLHKILLNFVTHQSQQAIIDTYKEMIFELKGNKCIITPSSRIYRHDVHRSLWK